MLVSLKNKIGDEKMNKSELMKNMWMFVKAMKLSKSEALKKAWSMEKAAASKGNWWASLTKDIIKAEAHIYADSARDWWRKAEENGVSDELKRYGYGILKGIEQRTFEFLQRERRRALLAEI